MNRRRLGLLFGALVLVVLAVACSDDGDEASRASMGEVIETPTGAVSEVSISPAGRMRIAGVLRVEADEPVRVEATATGVDEDLEVVIPRTAEARTGQRIPVVGLRAQTAYDVAVRAFDDEGDEVGRGTVRFTTGSLPSWFPELRIDVADTERMAPGYTLFDLQRWGVEVPEGQPSGILFILDPEGEVVWYHANAFGTGDARMTDAGTIINLYAPFGFDELDLLGSPIQSWALRVNEGERGDGGPIAIDAPQELVSLHHEVAPQPDGTILVFGRYQLDLSPAERRRMCPGDPHEFGIREDVVLLSTRDGEVLHDWPLHEVVDPAAVPGRVLCAEETDDYRDWAHGNGAVLDVTGNRVIVTARHIDLLFAFRYLADESGPSGELLWSIGPDGTLPLDGEPSYGVHAPELEPDGTIMVFDNGNDRPGTPEPYSRAVRYEIDDASPDPADWTARQVWEYRTDDLETGDPLYADFLGDADLQPNGNVLMDFGGIGQVDPPARGRIIEVIPRGRSGGDIVFDLTLPDTWTSYRAERLPRLYTGPRWERG